MILTDAKGVPFEKPEPPSKDAPIEETIAYIRSLHAHNDAVADCANKAFDGSFSREKLGNG